MKESLVFLSSFVGNNIVLSPILFIFLHVIRQFIYIPVAVICVAGGILFGWLLGMLYSLIVLMLSAALFLGVIHKFPGMMEKLFNVKQRWQERYAVLTVGQITILRLVPFIHYQLLSLCLFDKRPSFRGFMKGSLVANLPLVFFYTIFGQYLSKFTPQLVVLILLILSILFYVLRERIIILKWKDFFAKAEKGRG